MAQCGRSRRYIDDLWAPYGYGRHMESLWALCGRFMGATGATRVILGCQRLLTEVIQISVLLHYGPHNSLETFIIAKLYRFIKQKRQTLNQTWTKMNTCKNSNDRQSFSLLDMLKSSQSNLHLETWRSILWSWQFQNAVEVINAASIPTTGFTFTRIINQIITFWKILQ